MGLVSQVAEGNEKALEALYLKYRVNVFRFALTIVGDVFLAEDVMQETFLKVCRRADTFRFGSNEKGWIMTIAHHTAVDMLREKRRELPKEEVRTETIGYMETAAEKRDSDEAFLKILKPLKEVDRQIVSLHLIGELKHREIAKALGMSVGAVKKRYERAIIKLAKETGRYGYEEQKAATNGTFFKRSDQSNAPTYGRF